MIPLTICNHEPHTSLVCRSAIQVYDCDTIDIATAIRKSRFEASFQKPAQK